MSSRCIQSRAVLAAFAVIIILAFAASALGGVHKTILLKHFGDCC